MLNVGLVFVKRRFSELISPTCRINSKQSLRWS
jgi:hypothetical protein